MPETFFVFATARPTVRDAFCYLSAAVPSLVCLSGCAVVPPLASLSGFNHIGGRFSAVITRFRLPLSLISPDRRQIPLPTGVRQISNSAGFRWRAAGGDKLEGGRARIQFEKS